MEKHIRLIIYTLLALLITKDVHADVVWPAIFLVSRMITWQIILLGLAVEYVAVRKITNFGIYKSIVTDIAMNTVSSIIGTIIIVLTGVAWEVFPGLLLYKLLKIGTFNPITWTATFIFAVIINVLFEKATIRFVFKYKIDRKGTGILYLANAVSVGLAMISLWLVPKKL